MEPTDEDIFTFDSDIEPFMDDFEPFMDDEKASSFSAEQLQDIKYAQLMEYNYQQNNTADTVLSVQEHHRLEMQKNRSKSSFVSKDGFQCFKLPSLSPWKGQNNFNAFIPLNNTDKSSKWFYDVKVKKLFTCSNVIFPVNILLDKYCDGSFITVLPVFKDSNMRSEPVTPCYQCKNKPAVDNREHIIQAQTEGALYEDVFERNFIAVPLPRPEVGESYSTIFLRSICLTSCPGGPNRKAFSLVLTMWHEGQEMGRQIIDLKLSKGPFRDMNNEVKQYEKKNEVKPAVNTNCKPLVSISSTDSDSSSNDEKRLSRGNKVIMRVPTEFLPQIKNYINQLTAHDLVRGISGKLLPFPD